MTSEPLVSVVTIFWNSGPFLEEAIESVYAQTYREWELLLVDDGSTDESTAVARDHAARDPDRVRYLEHEGRRNLGMSASRNLGIRHARGEYVALLDADDVWLPAKLAEQVAVLVAHPELAMVYGATEWWYSWAARPEDREQDFVHDLGVPANTAIRPPTLLTLLLADEGISPCTCSMLLRRDALDRVGGFEDAFRGLYEDQVLAAKICLDSTVLALDTCSYRYRQHPASSTATAERSGARTLARAAFLDWLAGYLEAHRVDDPDLWRVVRTERRRLRRSRVADLLARAGPWAAIRAVARRPIPRKGGEHP